MRPRFPTPSPAGPALRVGSKAIRRARPRDGRGARQAAYGTERQVARALGESPVSALVNTAFVERHNATDRHRNARKGRRACRFSKDGRLHEAVGYFTFYTYNFCRCVHTLRRKRPDGVTHRPRTSGR